MGNKHNALTEIQRNLKCIKKMRPSEEQKSKAGEISRDDVAYQLHVKESLKDNDKIVWIIGKSVASDIRTTIRSMEYAVEVMNFLKRYNFEDGHSANKGVCVYKSLLLKIS